MKEKVHPRASFHEELTDGRQIPVVPPTTFCTKVNQRKYSKYEDEYLTLKELNLELEKGWRISAIQPLDQRQSDEEQMLSSTKNIAVLSDPNNNETKEALISSSNISHFRQASFKAVKMSNTRFYKCVCNELHVLFISFSYVCDTNVNVVTMNFLYIHPSNIEKTRTFQSTFELKDLEDFRFDIVLAENHLYLVWPSENYILGLDLQQADTDPSFTRIDLDFDMRHLEYDLLDHGKNIMITHQDVDFHDSVFSVPDASLRLSNYYSLTEGALYNTKDVIRQVSNIMHLDHPADVFLVEHPSYRLWTVTEWALPELSLAKIIFCECDSRGEVVGIKKILDFTELFQEYKSFFKTPNEFQHFFEICPTTWKLFVWSSKRDIVVVDLNDLHVVGVLRLENEKFTDYNAQRYLYKMNVSPQGDKLDVVVRKNKMTSTRGSYVHTEQFDLTLDLTPLNENELEDCEKSVQIESLKITLK